MLRDSSNPPSRILMVHLVGDNGLILDGQGSLSRLQLEGIEIKRCDVVFGKLDVWFEGPGGEVLFTKDHGRVLQEIKNLIGL